MGDDLIELQKQLATINANLENFRTDFSEFKSNIRELYTSKNEQAIIISGLTQTMENAKARFFELETHVKQCPIDKLNNDINKIGSKVNLMYVILTAIGTGTMGLIFKLAYDFITRK